MKQLFKIAALYLFSIHVNICIAQNNQFTNKKSYLELNWKELATKMPDEWYGSDTSKMLADSVLKYQTKIGGWSKNHNYHRGFNQEEWSKINTSGIGATIDNGATTTEMIFLTKMYTKVKDKRYITAFNRALNYLFEAQYSNGGWPQFFPYRIGKGIAYNSHITYNDDAMLHVMQLLRDIKESVAFYAAMNISKEMRLKSTKAFDKGIDCILKTQIKVKGKPTVWCAQHDEVNLLAANARAYELASFSGQESAGLVLLLMEINNPSNEIINAVKGAVSWFSNHRIEGIKLEIITSSGQKDRVVVEDKNAPALWARFYDLDTEKPFFCDRDGIKRKTFAELGYNRRNGYEWYTYVPEKIFAKYATWSKKWDVN